MYFYICEDQYEFHTLTEEDLESEDIVSGRHFFKGLFTLRIRVMGGYGMSD